MQLTPHLTVAAVLSGLLAAPAGMAKSPALQCPAGQQTVFACATTHGKQVQVCDAGATIGYRFGRPGQRPELELNVPRQRTSTWQWPGMGYTATYSATIPNGDTRYTVWSTMERGTDPLDIRRGIEVQVRGKRVANIACREDGIIDNLFDVDLPREN